MSVAVCGSRHETPATIGMVRRALEGLDPRPTVVIHGGATGVDSAAGFVARDMGIPVEVYEADWKMHGKMAGPIRNQRMARESKADLLMVFPGGAGTTDCAARFQERGIETRRV